MRRFAAALAIVTSAALFWVYAEVEAMKIGYEIRRQEESKVQALDRGRALKYNIARLKAPHTLERRLSAQKIQLESPKTWQTIVMPGAAASAGSKAVRQPYRQPPFFRFLVGTAQAEAKETSR